MKKDLKLIVKEEENLLNFLIKNIKFKSKNNVKSLLKWGNIFVNGNKVMKHDFVLKKDDVVLVVVSKRKIEDNRKDIDIIFEDSNIIVINKPNGLITISSNETQKSAYSLVQKYLKKINKNNKLYLVHRLDRDTSGVLLFAKNINAKKMFQENWDKIAIKRGYKALVYDNGLKDKDTLVDYLKEKGPSVFVSKEGKKAITKYKVMQRSNGVALVDVEIETGRKNQIRVQFGYLKCPVLGDKKYGVIKKEINRLALHADCLIIRDPFTNKKVEFKTDIPSVFYKVL